MTERYSVCLEDFIINVAFAAPTAPFPDVSGPMCH